MSRRGRALGFLLAAVFAAAAAAAIADGYGSRVARGYGELQPVLVAGSALPAGRVIDPERAAALELRRVPSRFVPPDALRSPVQALGLEPAAPIPAGAYLLASQLHPPPRPQAAGLRLRGGRRPVEIMVSGAGALSAGGQLAGTRVDVVVTGEGEGTGTGHTYVAAAAVPLLDLGPAGEASAAEGLATATLGLTREQALRLIDAESFARRVTILAAG